jgi:hypothetical protein
MLKLGQQGVAIAAGLREISYYRVRTQENKNGYWKTEMPARSRLLKNAALLGLKELPKTSIARMVYCCGLSLF